MKGIYAQAMDTIIQASIDKGGIISIDDVCNYARHMTNNKLDCHIVVSAQNGLGKSYTEMLICDKLGGLDFNEWVFADMPVEYFLDKIANFKKKKIVIDELANFFSYKQSQTIEQQVLFAGIEVARANCNTFIGATRDITRINNNYRNGKASLVIWLLDRFAFEDGSGFTDGVVLLGNPFLELEDKFFLSSLKPSYSYADMYAQFESLPSFVGYIRIGNIYDHIPKSITDEYEKLKENGVQSINTMFMNKLKNKQATEEKRRERLFKKTQKGDEDD